MVPQISIFGRKRAAIEAEDEAAEYEADVEAGDEARWEGYSVRGIKQECISRDEKGLTVVTEQRRASMEWEDHPEPMHEEGAMAYRSAMTVMVQGEVSKGMEERLEVK